MIKVDSVTKVFNNKGKAVTAVDNVSFTVNEGEVFGLIGTNGAGKTTLIRMISSMLSPSYGSIEVFGKQTVKYGAEVRKNTGILFGSEAGLYDRLTAYENIEYFARLSGVAEQEIDSKITKLAEFFDMGDYLHRRCGGFSKGMKQKVCFARSIVHNPKVMLFDEPTGGLDIIAAEEVLLFIKQMREQGKVILLSSHDMAEVEELCDRISIIDKGKILGTGTVNSLTAECGKNTLKEVFFHLTERKSA